MTTVSGKTFGFQVHLEAGSKVLIEDIFDKFMDFIEKNELEFGGGHISRETHYICGFLCYNNFTSYTSCTEQTRTLLIDWSSTQELTKVCIGELIPDSDLDYDYDCKEKVHLR